jgi:integrase
MIPMGDDLKKVLATIKSISKMRSTFVIHTEHGQPYTVSGVRSAFACVAERAGIKGVTLKDIRAKAAFDAAKQGYTTAQIKVALAHTDEATTRTIFATNPPQLAQWL